MSHHHGSPRGTPVRDRCVDGRKERDWVVRPLTAPRASAAKKQKLAELRLKGAAVIGHSGGPTVVINQSLVGFVTLKQD